MAIFNSYVKLPEGKIYINPMVSRSWPSTPRSQSARTSTADPIAGERSAAHGSLALGSTAITRWCPLVISWLKITVNYRYMSKKNLVNQVISQFS